MGTVVLLCRCHIPKTQVATTLLPGLYSSGQGKDCSDAAAPFTGFPYFIQ